MNKLNSDKKIEKLIPLDDLEETTMNLAIGASTSIPIAFASVDNKKYLLDKIDDNIKEGRMPKQGAYEIAVHWKLMNNKGWKIGQYVGNDVDAMNC